MRKKFNKHYFNVPLTSGEITLIVGRSAEDALRHSTTFARQFASIENAPTVMLVNCGISERRFNAHTENIPRYRDRDSMPVHKRPPIMSYNSTRGDLISDMGAISGMMCHADAGVLIIIGWEWTSSNYTRRQRLIYFLRELLADGIAIIIYAQTETNPVAGKNDRGGVGRLSALAFAVIEIETVERTAESMPSEKPVFMDAAEEDRIEREIQLMSSNFNNLQGNPTKRYDRYPLNDDEPDEAVLQEH
jgi:hypothetical protein